MQFSRSLISPLLGLLSPLILLSVVPVTAQVVGPNVNMVAGTEWPGGDPFLQRQNEPSIAVSSRNHVHLLAGSNDYRTVDLPGLPDGEPTGDAWLGLFKSFDGGATWFSTLIPGYPQDKSTDGLASPLKGLQAAADPVVRAGSNGLFYYSGIGLDRGPTGASKIFVARYIDNNNMENGDPISYLGTSVIATGSTTAFLDKPWIAVDVPRAQSQTCTIATPAQTFTAGDVYIVYTSFLGSEESFTGSSLMFARSLDCGVTWSAPIAINGTNVLNQGGTIAIDSKGAVYVAWRRFASGTQPDAILVAKSANFGQKFGAPVTVATFPAGGAFDEGTTSASFRTNAYPTMVADAKGRVYLAWSQRGLGPDDTSRIVLSSSTDGTTWTPAIEPDPAGVPGQQIMPTLAFAGGLLNLAYYDSRDDDTIGIFTALGMGQYSQLRQDVGDILVDPTLVFNGFISDNKPPDFMLPLLRRHTIDLRATQALPGFPLGFSPAFEVTSYIFGSRPGDTTIEQLQVDPPNLPMFKLGTVPFFGDYIDFAGQTILPDGKGGWKFNSSKSDPGFAHVVWTDNRDVRPPSDGNWANFTPTGSTGGPSIFDPTKTVPPCLVGQDGSRNQNIYTSLVGPGIVVGALGNTKPLTVPPAIAGGPGTPIQRGFSVFVHNSTAETRNFRFSILSQPTGGKASFLQNPVIGLPDPLVMLDVTAAPYSSVYRTVWAISTSQYPIIPVSVAELQNIGDPAPLPGGLTGSLLLNPDITNPNISNPNISNPNISNPNISNAEVYTPNISNPNISNPNISNPNISNPNISNPNISNPNISNPNISNFVVANPDIANPNISNPNISKPNISKPNISNPNISNSDLVNGGMSDTNWGVQNFGNTAASFSLKFVQNVQPPPGFSLQLIVYKLYSTPVSNQCNLDVQTQYVPVLNLINPVFSDPTTVGDPTITDPSVGNATVGLNPGENAQVTIRVFNPNRNNGITYDPSTAITPVLVSHGANTGTTQPTQTLLIVTIGLPPGVQGAPYSQPLNSTGGIAPLAWAIPMTSAGPLPPGLTLDPALGVIGGTPTTPGSYTFTVQATDFAGSIAIMPYTVVITNGLTVTMRPTLPAGIEGAMYSVTLLAQGGTPGYTWSIASGALPAGLTLNPATGVLSGPLAATGTFNFTVQVTDSTRMTASLAMTLVVTTTGPLAIITPSPLPNATVGKPYTEQILVVGGAPPYNWTAKAIEGHGSGLPPDFTINPNTGRIEAAPEAPTTATFSIRVTDSKGKRVAMTYTLTVVGGGD